ncbi:exodeoxyribonuclease VII large subunit [Alteromonas sp. C1M14]|uniref:exodeoxyribonuclease VII large subunit n=1 Tax=Alteromonas sp. C1M14 TaxID=2841567 RepID=UPI001C0865F2|nr:exodeoxyribonuclease VII large subunit [Alteromonas sp. C1M14]MBU2979147.1 exodeoxyribonuclease VII large subunit [Alteromonas sp. C1M14]
MIFNTPSTSRQILTVTKLNRLARTVLEGEIGLVWISAEISNFVCAASGHWYFTLKDNKAQVRAAMFKNTNRHIKHKPKEGDKVLVRASVGLYEPRGDYQLIAEHLEPDGEGQLKQAFEALKRKLQQDGLFDADAKRPLPQTITTIGVITSPSGAALHDVLTVLKRRSPSTNVIVYPTMVQGEQAPMQIINALETAYARHEVDVILLTRGGGSLEDLWCFNHEGLAHCISASPVPVVSAVGHEIDITIADFVADVRAPTPSAGAELLSQDQKAHYLAIKQQNQALERAWTQWLQQRTHRLMLLRQRLKNLHPANRLQSQAQSLDRYQLSLTHAMRTSLRGHQEQLNQLVRRLDNVNPVHTIQRHIDKQQQLHQGLLRAISHLTEQKAKQLAHSAQLLESVSPLKTLSRGYSITFQADTPLTSIQNVKKGQRLRTYLAEGEIISTVEDIISTGQKPD